MVYFKNNKFYMSDAKINYFTDEEGEVVKFIGVEGRRYWIELSEMLGKEFSLIKFIDVEISEDQINRLNEVNGLSIKEGIPFVASYIENGNLSGIGKDNPLYLIKLESSINKLKDDISSTQEKILHLQKQINLNINTKM